MRWGQINNYNVANSSLYSRFSADGVHNKPMIITETSALYIPSNSVGNSNYEIKSSWWEQVGHACIALLGTNSACKQR